MKCFTTRLSGPAQGSSQQYGPMMPGIEVSETDRELRINAELPGVSEKEIDVCCVDDILTIRAEKKLEKKGEGR